LTQRKTALITGATDGIGRATATALAARGWHVLVHGRSTAKAQAAAREIDGTAVAGDFTRLREVVALARQVREAAPELDALVNNAGIYAARRELTDDGFETTIAVNHFAPFVLTHHLLDALKAAPAGRIVNVSSMTHSGATLDPEELNMAHAWDPYQAYAASKLANIVFTRQLARNLKRTAITANALHPGVVGTKLLRAGFSIKGDSAENGARTSVYLADDPAVRGLSGRYFVDCREAPPARAARDDKLAQALWDATATAVSAFL
jgi:NAD(P)-dependent dehydrogenase (short-subunit alcohol dehydrogenase family)